MLTADLEGFFDTHSRSLAIGEAQRLPEMFAALRYVIDRSSCSPHPPISVSVFFRLVSLSPIPPVSLSVFTDH
jgi:hypothetical protein